MADSTVTGEPAAIAATTTAVSETENVSNIQEKKKDDEKEDAKKEEDTVDPTHIVPMFQLFKYATKKEVAMMCLAAFLSTASGGLNPCVILIMGDLLGNFFFLFFFLLE